MLQALTSKNWMETNVALLKKTPKNLKFPYLGNERRNYPEILYRRENPGKISSLVCLYITTIAIAGELRLKIRISIENLRENKQNCETISACS